MIDGQTTIIPKTENHSRIITFELEDNKRYYGVSLNTHTRSGSSRTSLGSLSKTMKWINYNEKNL